MITAAVMTLVGLTQLLYLCCRSSWDFVLALGPRQAGLTGILHILCGVR